VKSLLLAIALLGCDSKKNDADMQSVEQKAKDEAKAAREKLSQIGKDLEALEPKIAAAAEDLAKATSDEARVKAKAALDELKKQKEELEAKMKAAKGTP
jgi:DNA repair exonuclease SbcCD ATPase subunit